MRLNELDISKPELVEIAESWIFNTRNKNILYCKLDGDTYEEIAEETEVLMGVEEAEMQGVTIWDVILMMVTHVTETQLSSFVK